MVCKTENKNNQTTVGKNKMDVKKTRCIAWFKLAELVARKEKEKALNLYRLISHSLDDKAYALQVEGDILWALEDKAALEKYTQAAYLYKKEEKIVAATAVYEHLLTLDPENFEYLKTLILLYVVLTWAEKFEEKYLKLLDMTARGSLELGKIWDFTQNLLDFSLNQKSLKTKRLGQEFEFGLKESFDYTWLLRSLNFVLKDKNESLYHLLEKYCLDNQLNFNT